MFFRYLRALFDSFTSTPSPRTTPKDPLAVAYASACLDVGEREDPMGSNSGAYVEGLRAEVKLSRLAGGEWCAVFCSVHVNRGGIAIKSRGAKRLVNKLAKHGRKVELMDLTPGMCGVSLHKRSGGWHVRLWRCELDDGELVIDCVGGNEKHQVGAGRHSARDYAMTAKTMATI